MLSDWISSCVACAVTTCLVAGAITIVVFLYRRYKEKNRWKDVI